MAPQNHPQPPAAGTAKGGGPRSITAKGGGPRSIEILISLPQALREVMRLVRLLPAGDDMRLPCALLPAMPDDQSTSTTQLLPCTALCPTTISPTFAFLGSCTQLRGA